MKASVTFKILFAFVLISVFAWSCNNGQQYPEFKGTILLLKMSHMGSPSFKAELYEFTSKLKEPKKIIASYDSLLKHGIAAVNKDASLILFANNLLLNTKTGKYNTANLPEETCFHIVEGSFSPDNKYICLNTYNSCIYIYDIESNSTKKIFSSEYRNYDQNNTIYAPIETPEWLLSDAVFFRSHTGLPFIFYGDDRKYDKEFKEMNHLNIISKEGKVLLSLKDSAEYKVSENLVIRNLPFIDSKFDIKELLKGNYKCSEISDMKDLRCEGMTPNSKYLLSSKIDSIIVIELKSRKKIYLPKGDFYYVKKYYWSADTSMVACIQKSNHLFIGSIFNQKEATCDLNLEKEEAGYNDDQWSILAWLP